MAELQRVNPQAAKAIGVPFSVPNGSAAKLGVAEAALKALGAKGQGRDLTAKALHNLAGAVENLGGTIATIEGEKAQKNIAMATDLDMRSYSLALADAQKQAREEFDAKQYGTFAEANNAYAKLIQEKMDKVTADFFPQSTDDRVPGSYFRYAKELNLTLNDPRIQQMQLDTAHAGAEQMYGDWQKEQAKINSTIINAEATLLRQAQVTDPDKYKQLIQQYAPEMFISNEGLDKWANAQVTLVYQESITDLVKARLESLPGDYVATLQRNLEAKVTEVDKNGKKTERNLTFEEAINNTAVEMKDAMDDVFDDEMVKEFAGRKEYKYLEGWLEDLRQGYATSFFKSLDEAEKAVCQNELRDLCSKAGITPGAKVALPAAYQLPFLTKYEHWGENTKQVKALSLVNVKMSDGSTYKGTHNDLFNELWMEISHTDFTKKDGVTKAEAIIDASEWLTKGQQERLKFHMAQRMDFCANAKERPKATKAQIDSTIVAMFEKNGIHISNGDLKKTPGEYVPLVNQLDEELARVSDPAQLADYAQRAFAANKSKFFSQQTRSAAFRKVAGVYEDPSTVLEDEVEQTQTLVQSILHPKVRNTLGQRPITAGQPGLIPPGGFVTTPSPVAHKKKENNGT